MAGPPAVVVYVHGLWMQGVEGLLLRKRLSARRDFRCVAYRYHSVREPMERLANALAALVFRLDAPCVHLLGHSLGGLVILRCLQRHPDLPPGRVVFLGTPVRGSRAARMLAQVAVGRHMLGRAAAEELLEPAVRRWDCGRELGIIAGTAPVGLGNLLLTFGEQNDGAVAVSETELAGATASLRLPVSHSGMLLSARVAREAGSFLQHGRFGS